MWTREDELRGYPIVVVDEAAPWGDGPVFLIRDNDRKYGSRFSAIAKGTGIKEICIPFGAPNANVYRAGYFAHPLLKTGKQLETPSPKHYVDCKSKLAETQNHKSIIVDWVADS